MAECRIGRTMLAALAAVAIAVAGVLLAGCAGNGSLSEGLPEWGDEAALTEQAQALVSDYSARDYEAVAQRCAGLGLSAADFAESGDAMLDTLGEFASFADAAYMTGADDEGRAYAVVIQVADYASGSAQYTVSFYEDGTVCGFYAKPL